MKDLSAKNPFEALSVTSQAAGNTVDDRYRDLAMTAPGSAPVDPLPDSDVQDDPQIDVGPVTKMKHLVADETANSVPAAPHGWSKI